MNSLSIHDEDKLKCKTCGSKTFNIDTYIGFNYISIMFGLSSGEVVHNCSCVNCGRKFMFTEA